MKKRLHWVFLLIPFITFAQDEDAWVFFVDKENVSESIANPISILTQEAIDRKEMHGVAIDERDVPVNESYISQVKAQTGIIVLAKSKWFNCVHVRGSQEAIDALEALQFVDSIEFADDSLTRSSEGFGFVKGDPEDVNQQRVDYTYGATENQVTMLSADFLHQQDFTGAGMIVAVLDSGFPGIDTNAGFARVRDNGRLLDGYDFVDRVDDEFAFSSSSHGTRTASDIVGFIEDQFVGTAPDAFLYCFRTEDVNSENPVEESYWVEAAERADSLGVDVINTSLGYRGYDNPAYSYTYEDMNGQTAFISRGSNIAFEKGMLLVTSAGNSGTGMIGAPADAPGVLTVGAVNSNGNYVSFSSIGPSSDGRVKPDVMAKGQSSAVITPNGNIDTSNGTSFSSPIMAGAVTSLWQAFPERTNAEIMQFVRESAHLFNAPTPQMGYGIPNFEDAFNAFVLSVEESAFAKAYTVSPNPANSIFQVQFPEGSSQARILVYDLLGKRVLSKEISKTNNSIDVHTLTSGVYIIQIQDSERSTTQKLIKQ
ncbi:peptidase S8 [Dokdonia pacifica]|uniref:Por secretion system C-terminal sorting domain-containing protein n=1 Tax=Dokdonia pacifica TaxID=1627892 RepID=A0A239AVM9_9FLAO|nr:S8 family serine peptidase [Dokdonia pacifica]GGG31759.1 peptidase S8 [Dokdonia pacifica]SNR99084.1 Por secretion system C-terminal sorting domain-containing protein [Dokdonia pacifica]